MGRQLCRGWVAAVVALFAISLVPQAALTTDQASLGSLAGGWMLESREPDRTIERAIDEATRSMPFGVRQIARHALRENTPIVYNVIIAERGGRLAVTYDRHTYRGPADGSTFRAVGPSGTNVMVRYRMANDDLVQDVRGGGGGREDTFRVSDGSLWVSARIHHPDLPNDVRFRLRYRSR